MNAVPRPPEPFRREALRLVPLVSLTAFVGLAGCGAYGSVEGSRSLFASCWIPEGCPALSASWGLVAVAFGSAAGTVGALFAADTLLAARGRALRLPPGPVLLSGIALLGFGLGGFAAVDAESHGGLPIGSGAAVWVAYVVAALLLFAVAFLGHRPSSRPLECWAKILAASHGFVGMGPGLVLAYLAVARPDWMA